MTLSCHDSSCVAFDLQNNCMEQNGRLYDLSATTRVFGDQHEKRMLRVTVQEELFPITGLSTTSSLAPAIRDIFRCQLSHNAPVNPLTMSPLGYKWLYEEARILHGDISLNNLMYCKKQDETICGVLIDYDILQRPTSRHLSSAQERNHLWQSTSLLRCPRSACTDMILNLCSISSSRRDIAKGRKLQIFRFWDGPITG